MIQSQDLKSCKEQLRLSSNAVAHIKSLIAKEAKNQSLMLRIIIEGGGCSGFQYHFKLDQNIQSDDIVFNQDGISVVVDTISFELIEGSEIDFVEQLIGSSFVIHNPKAASGCGCGNSFAL